MVEVFHEVRRCLRQDGTCWLVIGDSYYSTPTGSLSKKPSRLEGGRTTMRQQVAVHGVGPERIAACKHKDLVGIPWMLAFALRADGWYLRQDIIWSKPNPMPESVTDRCCKSHEHVFLLAKSKHYYFDHESLKEPCVTTINAQARNSKSTPNRGPREGGNGGLQAKALRMREGDLTRTRRDVWRISTQPYKEAHFATFPEELVTLALLAGVSARCCEHCAAPWVRVTEKTRQPTTRSFGKRGEGGQVESRHSGRAYEETTTTTGWRPTCKCRQRIAAHAVVLDPFCGSGTTGAVARRYGLNFIGIDLNKEYLQMARRRIARAEAAR